MRLGISLPMFTDDPARPLERAGRAEDLGFDGVFAADHLHPPGEPSRSSLEPFSTLAAVAARHPRLHVGTLVARVTLRPPGVLAKQAAALDAMTGGRAILGLGAGDALSRGEHQRFGLAFPPMAERRRLLEETAAAVRSLASGRPWPGGAAVPALAGPLLPPGAPAVWVGGVSDAALAISARSADGWNAWGLDDETFARRASTLRELAGDRAVEPSWGGVALVARDEPELARLRAERSSRGLPMDIWSGTVEDLRRFAGRLADAGAGWAVFVVAGPADRMELLAGALRPR